MTQDKIRLDVTAAIRSDQGYGTLNLHETVELGSGDFRTVARALERFHGFGERLRAEILGDVVTAVDEVQELAGDVAAAAAPVRSDGGRLRWHCTGCHAVFEQWKVNEFHGPYYEDGTGHAHALRDMVMTWAELAELYGDCVGHLALERA